LPGSLPHMFAGSIMYFIGRYYFRRYFDSGNKTKELILLAVVCLICSLIPDFFLAIYYTTHISPFETFLPYHDFIHLIFTPLAIAILLTLKYIVNTKRGPIWVMGLWSIILHLIMDLFIQEHGVWI